MCCPVAMYIHTTWCTGMYVLVCACARLCAYACVCAQVCACVISEIKHSFQDFR